jgi:bifunctional ADP-heptose synthase (sugar kinase/adenylyltransferase)
MEKFKTFASKSIEHENAKKSSLQSHKQDDTHIKVSVHAGAQALLRRPDLTSEHWNKMKNHIHDHLRQLKSGHYLAYSHNNEQGLIIHHEPEKKQMTVMTVLPKGKQAAKTGTLKVIIESIDYSITIYELCY